LDLDKFLAQGPKERGPQRTICAAPCRANTRTQRTRRWVAGCARLLLSCVLPRLRAGEAAVRSSGGWQPGGVGEGCTVHPRGGNCCA